MDTVYTVNEHDLSFRVLDGEAVIVSGKTGFYYALNRSGTLLWHLLLDGGRSPAAAAEAIAVHYGADLAAISRDVETALAEMLAENLILPGTPPASANGKGLPAGAPDHAYEQPQLVKFDRLERLMVCGE